MHVTANPVIVGPQGFADIWTSASANYFPLTLTNFWIQHALWGLTPGPFHGVNIAMQAGCAVVLWRVLARLAIPGAWLGAALWALHPVQAESVAWISELKNTQACLFFLLSISAFLDWLERAPGISRRTAYARMFVFAVCAILSKASAVMLPAALVLCAWWRCGRWSWRHVLVLLPLFALSAAASGWTIWEQKYHSFAQGQEWQQTFGERVVIAGRAVWFYVGKLFWPHPLMFIYPRWEPRADLAGFLPFGGVLATVGLLFAFLPRTRAFLFAALFFGALLFPILGFFNVYFFRYSFVADHFQHLASIGPLALAGAGVTLLCRRLAARFGRATLAVPAALLLLLGLLTARETSVYHDSQSLWRSAYERNPAAWMAATILGNHEVDAGRHEAGLRLHEAALRVNPDAFETNYNLGLALKKLGRTEEAVAAYRRALALKPNFPEAEHNLAVALLVLGRTDEALARLRRSLRIKPQPETHHFLGVALSARGLHEAAAAEFAASLRLRPDQAPVLAQSARVLHTLGRTADAFAAFRRALALAPSDSENRAAFATALALAAVAAVRAGNLEAADAALREALAVRPDFADAPFHVASALAEAGRPALAADRYREALRLRPAYAEAHYNLALLLQAAGLLRDAAHHAGEARRLRPDLPPLP